MFGKFTGKDTQKRPLRRRAQLRLTMLAVLCSTLLLNTLVVQAGAFSSPFFQRLWQRADYPVVIGAAQRGFTWGPSPFFSSFEPYVESPNGQRRVEYFDKARMEITRPDFNSNSDYFVTNGLIVKEMVMGGLQTGDYVFAQRYPAYDVAVVGDPIQGNPDTVTYASFYALNTYYNTISGFGRILDRQADRTNERVTETIAKGGAVGRNELLGSLEGVNYTFYERTLGHNVPKVFYDFLNQSGQIFNGSNLLFGKVFDWTSTMGYPITDAYWTKAAVGGTVRDVLVQLYERRVLTYTPTNANPFKVEMGNVGRHYYDWRYNQRYDLSIPQQSSTEVKPEAGFPGVTIAIKALRFIQNEDIETTITTPDGHPLNGRLIIGPTENPTGFTFFSVYLQTNANTQPGLYTIYFRGRLSGNEAKAYFFILGIPGFNLPPQ